MKRDRAIKPDAQAFDEIRIITVPRWKTSELSGDEWRISATIQFFRNGTIVCEKWGLRNVETACGFLFAEHSRAVDEGNAYFAGEGRICDQEGCCAPATVASAIKQNYCVGPGNCGQVLDPPEPGSRFRLFCERHRGRGDCDLEDADENYEEIPLPSEEPKEAGDG